MTSWPTDWTRPAILSLRNTALRNAEKASAECVRRRLEREDAEQATRDAVQRLA